MDLLITFFQSTGFASMTWQHAAMIFLGLVFLFLAIRLKYEPLLMVPIGLGMIIGNIPYPESLALGTKDPGSVFYILYQGVDKGIYPPLIFLGIGAMTDFSSMIANPKLVLLGAAAQVGIFITLLGGLALGFTVNQSAAIGIIGGADGPTAIFLSSILAPELLGPIAIAAYSYMSLVPIIQPPIMHALTTKEERKIRMPPPRNVTRRELIIFPIACLVITLLIVPATMTLLGMLFLGNLLKECTVTDRLANTARNGMIDVVTILLGFCVGVSTHGSSFLSPESIKIFILGITAFSIATACGLLFARFMNLFLKEKINPLLGAAGVSAVPQSARVVQKVGQDADPQNFLLMHAMAPNVAGVIGSAIAAGVLLSVLAP
ncbi:MAG: sodium ion-translocating decarboxylase subunit beta [Verrucomicrobia bacterium]|nr:sodium ion-translocating decarboxylase subunit beta [Verrucomicrobiota bacterium]MCH8526219.1 sodium ion-translocating decarboxylase subunit beta [Kiritimatiellia bacterium]